MTAITLCWLALPFLVGFIGYLVPKLDRSLALGVSLISLGYGLFQLFAPPLTLGLLDHFGVTLIVDSLSGFLIVTNAIVTTAFILYCWQSDRTAFFYTQVTILQGSVNSALFSPDQCRTGHSRPS
jgi:multicomponent Na+:H+ antiporter subunit D